MNSLDFNDLSYGGRNAWAYKKLTRDIDIQSKILSLFGADNRSLELELRQIDSRQTSMIIEGEFIDLGDVRYLTKRIKRLGEKKALKLLVQYGSIDRIRNANVMELVMIDGIGEKLAKRIIANL